MGAGTLLDLMLSSKEELVRDMKVRDQLGCSSHQVVEFRILRGGNNAKSRITTLDLGRADFDLYWQQSED